jgi:hypothetical protein
VIPLSSLLPAVKETTESEAIAGHLKPCLSSFMLCDDIASASKKN